MSYQAAAAAVDRLPALFVELDADTCANTFGSAPCTASLGTLGRCYNTRASCQDAANYNRISKTYRFSEPLEGLPASVQAIPSLVSVSAAPTRLTPGKGLGYRASVTVTLMDHPHHDRGLDPYHGTRTHSASAMGTFWTKFLARNRHYNGRILRVRSGFIASPWDWAAFESREYVIERIEGPDEAGRVRIIAKDILKLADDKRAQCPKASTGALTANITATDTALSVTAGTGPDYGTSGHVRIADEVIGFTGRTGDTLTGLTHGQWGTDAADHDAGDAVQLCKSWTAANVRDIIDELLTAYAGISSSYINATDWDSVETSWLSSYTLTTILSEPTGVNKLLAELMEQCQLMLWWDDRAQQIRLKALAPPQGNLATTLNESIHFVADSLSVKDETESRITQLWIYYDPANYTDNARKNYRRLYIAADLDAESLDQYGDQRIEVIESRWFDENNAAAVIQTASRAFAARLNTPKRLGFALDAKDMADYTVGDIIDIETARLVDFDGNPKTARGVIIEELEAQTGTRIEYIFLSGVGQGRFGFVGPNTLSNYSAESAANRAAYGFVGPDSGPMPDGEERYKII